MIKPIVKTVKIHAGVSSNYLENSLTTDISVLESIFDLIDNSIDAARDHLLLRQHECDKYGLPKDYSGYSINIRLGEKYISILDNCLGIEESTLTQKVFITADTSNHRFGIGHYGLGLKRALLKFGKNYAMSTDDGAIAFKMKFDEKKLSGNKPLIANAYKSSGKRKTLFIVSNIKKNIAYEIQNKSWFENAVKKLAERYAVYANKGLSISITSTHHKMHERIFGNLPLIRENAKFSSINIPLKIDGVDVYIDAGVHGDYYFPAEKGSYSLTKNRLLTEAFGLYFICNDRVIVSSSTANEHGWKTKWHSEYNGFICIVRFVSEDSSKMPWNTVKSALQTDSRLFMEVKQKLQLIADGYRKDIKKLYPAPRQVTSKVQPEVIGRPTVQGQLNSDVGSQSSTKATMASIERQQQGLVIEAQHAHVKDWVTLLPSSFPLSEDEILNAYLIDATKLKCSDAPCAAAILCRVILEKSLKIFIKRKKLFQSVKDYFYSTAEGVKKNHSEEYKQSQGLDLSMMLNWLKNEKTAISMFGIEDKPILWLATKKASEHVSKLNGVAHGTALFATGEVLTIRNELYPLLKFLVINDQVTQKLAT